MTENKGMRIVISGKKYDLGKMIFAAEAIIGELAARCNHGQATVDVWLRQLDRRLVWPDPGRADCRDIWFRAAEFYDAVDDAMVVRAGPVTLFVSLLGRNTCVYDDRLNVLKTGEGRCLDTVFDPSPDILICGPEAGTDQFRPLNSEQAEDVGRALAVICGEKSGIGLSWQETAPKSGKYFARLDFQHRSYGSGEGVIKVRCILPDSRITWRTGLV